MTTIPAYTFGGVTRPQLYLDATGHIVLTPAAQAFVATYGIKALYIGVPAGTPFPPVAISLSTPTDSNAAANGVAEGAPANTQVNLNASATTSAGFPVTYSLVGDTSGGGFKIDAATGVVTVANPAKIDFESAPGHAYSVTVQASDGILTSAQTFSIAVSDVAPAAPADTNGAANSVAEGAAAGTLVGITVQAPDINGGAVAYSLSNNANGAFKIDATTGVVTAADPTKIDYESLGPGHSLTITALASDGTLTSTQNFTIAVTDVAVSTPVDTNASANTVVEGAANGTALGITASGVDPNGPASTYALTDNSNGRFAIDPVTGVVTVADATKIDFESAPGHAYSITVQATVGATSTSQTFTIAVTDAAPSKPVDSNAASNVVTEGAANGSTVGITVASADVNGPAVTYALIGDTSGGGFTINAATGVITVADATRIDYESAAGHAYTVTVQASDGTLASSQTFTIAVADVAPSPPVDSNAAANSVAEGATNGSAVGVTVSSTDINGPAVTYSLVGDTSGGGFAINAATGVITVADSSKIDYESSGPTHSYTVTAQASDGTFATSNTFTINVADVAPSLPVDADVTTNAIVEGAANGSTVGVTVSATDVNGPAVTYSLIGDTSGGGFTINATTGVISIADPTKIDYETSGPTHSYTVTAQASDGTLVSTNTFTIAVSDVAPSTPVDSDAGANSVVEGAAAGSTVGITASSTDVNGPAVTYSLIGNTSGGGFTINAATGVVTVADPSKIDYESTAPGHAYTVTAQASDGTLTSSQSFTIGVTDAAPSLPVDSDATANSVVEGVANGSTVGVTVSSIDVNGPAVTYALTGDTSGGGFTINSTTGVITVADSTKIDFETSGPTHSYTVTAQASDGTLATPNTFTINVADVSPSLPVDADVTANAIAEGAANGSTVGVTVSATDVNGPAVTYSLTGDTSGGGFTINATTGVVSVADSTKIDFETSGPTHSYTVTAQASDGTLTNSNTFTIAVSDVAPSVPVDSDGAGNIVAMNAPVGFYAGITASSTDVNGPAVTYSLVGDTSGGGFTVNPTTGRVTVADSTKIPYNAGSPTFDVTVQASDGTLSAQQTFTVTIVPNAPPVANDDALSATEAGGANNSVAGVNPSGNVILGTGSGGAVQDTDAEDASPALTVVAVHTGAEGASTGTGTVGQDLIGLHGTLHLNSNGSYTYAVNQTDAQVQALHGPANTITDQFNYTIQDTGGLQDTATITFTIHGADDLPVANADTGTMSATDAPTSFNVIANDSQDPDSTATNAITLAGGITVTGPAGETFVNTDATASIVSNQIQVTLNNAHFQQLALGEHATVTVPYTLTGDTGETSSANLVVTVNGANDVPTAVNDSGAMTEDQSGQAFTVLTNDTLDIDHGAANSVTTTSTITNLSAPAGRNIDVSDISVSVNGSNQLVVNLGADIQRLKTGETVTFDVDYTLHGDQAGDTSTATLHVTINGITDALDITPNSPPSAAYTENTAASALLSIGSISAGDNDIAGGSYTVVITANASAGDQILLLGSSQFALSGSSLLYAGDVVGTISGLGTSSVSVTSFTAAATATVLSDMAKAFGFQNSTDNPATAARTVTFTFSDGATSDTVSQTVNVTALNDAPVNTVPTAMLSTNQNTDLTITGLSVSDVDSQGSSETTTLQVTNGTLTVASAGGASVSGSGTATVTLTGTIAQINTTLAAANNVVYHPTTGTTGAATLTVTTNDGGHSPSGALSDTDTVSLYVNPPALSGQLWYLGQGNPTDARLAYMNISAANGSNAEGTTTVLVDNNPGLDLGTAVPVDVQIDWAAGLYYVLSNGGIGDHATLLMGHIGSSAAPTVVYSPNPNDILNTIQIDSASHHLYVGTTEGTAANPATTGILDFTYNTTTGALTAVSSNGGYLLKSNQQTTIPNYGAPLQGPLFITTDFAFDPSTNKLFWNTLSNGSAFANGAYWIDLSDPTNVHQLIQQSQFPFGSADSAWTNGYIQSIEVDPGTTTVYFATYSQHPSPDATYNAALNKIYYISESATGSTAAVALTITGLPGGNHFYPGAMTFDPTLRQLYVVSEETTTSNGTIDDVIYVLQLSADGHSASLVNTISVTNPVFTQDAANLGGMAFDALPVPNVGNSTYTEGTPAKLAPTMTITDTGSLKGATINTYGGFAGDGDTLTFSTAGTSIVGNLTSSNGNLTLTFTGIDTVAHYQQVLQSVTFSSGENPTNFGDTNTTRSIVWHLDDGALGNLFGSANTKTTTLTITDVNDAPVLDLDGGSGGTSYATSYTANGPFVAIADSDDSVSDVDNQTLASATITLTDAKAGDILAISGSLPNGISAVITPGAGIITVTLSGSASAASYQAALHQVVFANSGDTVDTSDRHFNVTVNDGTAASAVATTTVHVSSPLLAADGGIASTSGAPGEMHLSQAQLDGVVSAAIAQWAAAGASASQLAAMHATTFSVADLAGKIIGDESSPAHITIDVNAAGHGWFIDPSPWDNFEFAHAANAAGTDLYADPASTAAGHLDLLTTVAHELGHVIGLPDTTNSTHDLMHLYLADGERRLPDDVALTGVTPSQQATAPALQPVVAAGPAHMDTVVQPAGTLFGGGSFVFQPFNAPVLSSFTHLTDLFKGLGFDFSASPIFHAAAGLLEEFGAAHTAPQGDTGGGQPVHTVTIGGWTFGPTALEHQHSGWLV
ncbi:cadherin domain-containing protein [Bradyrhizobium diazoefficiens]|nr:cadherin domain-containing protein [Bradyrhizobium diazoefficiens]MBR0852348.1 cadherin domain-containing protein [Bradyrhizobium diazoefficiens]